MLVRFEPCNDHPDAVRQVYSAGFTEQAAMILVHAAMEHKSEAMAGREAMGGTDFLLDDEVIADTPDPDGITLVCGDDSFWSWTEGMLASYGVRTSRIPRIKTKDQPTAAAAADIVRFLRHDRIARGPQATELAKQLQVKRLAAQAALRAADIQHFEDGGMDGKSAA